MAGIELTPSKIYHSQERCERLERVLPGAISRSQTPVFYNLPEPGKVDRDTLLSSARWIVHADRVWLDRD